MEIDGSELDRNKFCSYFKRCLSLLPGEYCGLDSTRIVLGQFCLGGIDLFGGIEEKIPLDKKADLINWIYKQQVTLENCGGDPSICGFRGGSFPGAVDLEYKNKYANSANSAATYSALVCLAILGDDYSRVDCKGLIGALKYLRKKDGSFVSNPGEHVGDMRFVFTACAISYLLNDWSGIDSNQIVEFILKCINYDGGIGQNINQESHGGSFYCAIASLKLLGRLDAIADIDKTVNWALDLQKSGFCGRTNKVEDTCYTFWVGAGVTMLGFSGYIDKNQLVKFVFKCIGSTGGVSKTPNSYPDPLHSYLSLAGISFICDFPGLNPVVPEINLTVKTLTRLKSSSKCWNN